MQVHRVNTLTPPPRSLTLIVAGCKGPRLRWMVEKCTELGVSELCLAEFERSVVRVSEGHAQKLRTTAIEACKQCGRAWLPEIRCGVTPGSVIRSTPFDRLAIAHADAAAPSGADWFAASEPNLRVETAAVAMTALWAACQATTA